MSSKNVASLNRFNRKARGLCSRKATVQTQGQTSKRKYKKIFLRRLSLSRFMAKILAYTLKSFPINGFLRIFSWHFYLLSEFMAEIYREEVAENIFLRILF